MRDKPSIAKKIAIIAVIVLVLVGLVCSVVANRKLKPDFAEGDLMVVKISGDTVVVVAIVPSIAGGWFVWCRVNIVKQSRHEGLFTTTVEQTPYPSVRFRPYELEKVGR